VLTKPHSLVVADKLEVCWTYNRNQMNLLYRGVKHCRRTRPFKRSSRLLSSTTPQKYTFDRRRKDLSGRTARLTSQDQPTVSHRGSSRTRGVGRHLERRRVTSRQKRQRVNAYHEISTLAPFSSIACIPACRNC